MKKIVKTYLHSSKEDNRETFGKALGLSEDEMYEDHKVLDKLAYALYEVAFELEVDTETGDYEIMKVDGKRLIKNESKS